MVEITQKRLEIIYNDLLRRDDANVAIKEMLAQCFVDEYLTPEEVIEHPIFKKYAKVNESQIGELIEIEEQLSDILQQGISEREDKLKNMFNGERDIHVVFDRLKDENSGGYRYHTSILLEDSVFSQGSEYTLDELKREIKRICYHISDGMNAEIENLLDVLDVQGDGDEKIETSLGFDLDQYQRLWIEIKRGGNPILMIISRETSDIIKLIDIVGSGGPTVGDSLYVVDSFDETGYKHLLYEDQDEDDYLDEENEEGYDRDEDDEELNEVMMGLIYGDRVEDEKLRQHLEGLQKKYEEIEDNEQDMEIWDEETNEAMYKEMFREEKMRDEMLREQMNQWDEEHQDFDHGNEDDND